MTLNDRECPDTSQGGEAVEVVGYHNQISKDWSYVGRVGWEPLMTVAQHQRILAAATRPADQGGEAVGEVRAMSGGMQYAALYTMAGQHLVGTKLYTHPADQVEDDLTMVKVSRELLEEIVELHRRRGVVLIIHVEHLAELLNGGRP